MKWLDKLRNKGIIKNRKVTRARFLYLYIIFGAIGGFIYFFVALVWRLPIYFALTPLYLFVLFIIFHFLVKNWKLIYLYIRDTEQGRLLLFLNNSTHWSEEHKMRAVGWIYLRRKTIRKETYAEISAKIMDGVDISDKEKKMFRFKSVYCPQQIKLGFNEALLIHVLIYCHENIQVLDQELRDIMELTDEHILAFDLTRERKKAGGDEYDKYIEIGERNSNLLNE